MAFDLMNDLGIMAIARSPDWKLQTNALGYTGAPATLTAGVTLLTNLNFAVRSLVVLSPRERAHEHRSRVTISTWDGASTYRVTINGTNVDYNAASGGNDADIEETLAGIANALNTDGTVGSILSATVEDRDGDGTDDTVVIANTVSESTTHTTAVSVTVGSAVMAFDEDAIDFDMRVWLLPTSGGANGAAAQVLWAQPQSAVATGVDYRGFSERLDVAGFQRAYVELENITNPSTVATDARPIILHGPALLEGS